MAIWLGAKFLLPALLPFALGLIIALAAEPAVGLCVRKAGLPRSVAAGVGVSGMLLLLTGGLSLAGALAVRELGSLAGKLPQVQKTLQQGLVLLEDSMIRFADTLPEGIRTVATGTVLELAREGEALMDNITKKAPAVVTQALGKVPDGALGLGTGVLAGFMISARLPRLRQYLAHRMPKAWYERYLPALRRIRTALWGWMKAQGKLALVTYGILAVGFLALGISGGLWWAILIALVDAVPVLGTGVVLLPWALVCFLQGQTFRGVGLAVLCVATMVVRRILEPKLVGKQLGLDPLATLLFLYMGYCFWGFGGMIVAPLLASAAKSLVAPTE